MSSGTGEGRRVLVVWCPDWPVVAAMAERELGDGVPVAVVAHNTVVACNEAARADGVRRRMRRRDAQARCPDLALIAENADRDARAFEPVVVAVEELRPGVAPLRPGLVAVWSPGRFYGGDEAAGAVIAQRLVEAGVWDCRIGVADDLFTAEQAARLAGVQDTQVVPPGGSAAFLRGLPVEVIDDAELVSLVRRLGLATLADFTALPERDVLARFGAAGARIHRLVSGRGGAMLPVRTPPPEWACEVAFEPPLSSVEAVRFSVRQTADRVIEQLAGQSMVCTQVRIDAETDGVVVSSRSWVHARWFTAADLVDRIHWQLTGQVAGAGGAVGPVGLAVGRVRFTPETVEPVGAHASGLWGGGTDDRVEHAVARVQGMLGHDAVTVPVPQGGRSPADRQAFVPWGERSTESSPADRPWPGDLPSPAPSRIFVRPRPVAVLDEGGRPVTVSERGVVSAAPARLRPTALGMDRHGNRWRPIEAWAGPWPVDEAWWEDRPAGLVARFQLVTADGQAWLARCGEGGWVIEAGYD